MTKAANLNTDPNRGQLPFPGLAPEARTGSRLTLVIAGLLVLWLISGCNAEPPETTEPPSTAESTEPKSAIDAKDEPQSTPTPEELVRCPDKRPDVCTQQYDPACGYFERSDDDSSEEGASEERAEKTFGNACTACADAGVVGYTPGACED